MAGRLAHSAHSAHEPQRRGNDVAVGCGRLLPRVAVEEWQRRTRLRTAEIGGWLEAGFTDPETVSSWCHLGIDDPRCAAAFVESGLNPADAVPRWPLAGGSAAPRTASGGVPRREDPDRSSVTIETDGPLGGQVLRAGVAPEDLCRCVPAGMDPDDGYEAWSRGSELEPADVLHWLNAHDAPTARRWLRAGVLTVRDGGSWDAPGIAAAGRGSHDRDDPPAAAAPAQDALTAATRQTISRTLMPAVTPADGRVPVGLVREIELRQEVEHEACGALNAYLDRARRVEAPSRVTWLAAAALGHAMAGRIADVAQQHGADRGLAEAASDAYAPVWAAFDRLAGRLGEADRGRLPLGRCAAEARAGITEALEADRARLPDLSKCGEPDRDHGDQRQRRGRREAGATDGETAPDPLASPDARHHDPESPRSHVVPDRLHSTGQALAIAARLVFSLTSALIVLLAIADALSGGHVAMAVAAVLFFPVTFLVYPFVADLSWLLALCLLCYWISAAGED